MAGESEKLEAFRNRSAEFVVSLCSQDTPNIDVFWSGIAAVMSAADAMPQPTNIDGIRKALERLRGLAS